MKRVVMLCGKSGSGKDAIKAAVIRKRPEYNNVINSTTRPMREGETNGKNYRFYDDHTMAIKIFDGEMAECVVFRDWVYGTEYAELKDDVINVGIWNPEGVETLTEDPLLDCLVIYIFTPDKVRLLRALNREENPDVKEMIRRFGADEKDFEDIDFSFGITVNNDGSQTIDEVADKVIRIIDGYLGKC